MCFMFVISPPNFWYLTALTTDPGGLVLVCLHFCVYLWCVCVCLTWDLFVFMCSFVMICVCPYVFVCYGTTSPDSWFYGISLLRLLATDPGPPLSFNTGPARPLQPAIKMFWNISKYFERWDDDFKRPPQAAIKIFSKKGRDGAREQSEIYLDLQNYSGADNNHLMLCSLGNILKTLLVWKQYKQQKIDHLINSINFQRYHLQLATEPSSPVQLTPAAEKVFEQRPNLKISKQITNHPGKSHE